MWTMLIGPEKQRSANGPTGSVQYAGGLSGSSMYQDDTTRARATTVPNAVRLSTGMLLSLRNMNSTKGNGRHWRIVDDDDYLIDDERRIVAKEVGWCLRREVIR